MLAVPLQIAPRLPHVKRMPPSHCYLAGISLFLFLLFRGRGREKESEAKRRGAFLDLEMESWQLGLFRGGKEGWGRQGLGGCLRGEGEG